MLEEIKDAVRKVAVRAQHDGLCKHKSGNFSVHDPETGYVVVTPSGIDRDELKVDDMVLSFRTEGTDDNVSGGVFYLDSLPYVEGDEVYIPVRAVAEALGYEVQWSDTYRTAVLVDVDTLAAEFLDVGDLSVGELAVFLDQDGDGQAGNGEGQQQQGEEEDGHGSRIRSA